MYWYSTLCFCKVVLVKLQSVFQYLFQAVRELQNSARDTIFLLKALLSEIQKSSEDEKKAVTDLYDLMMEKITEMKTELLNEVDRYIYQCLMTQMSTLQVHIFQEAKLVLSVTCTCTYNVCI